MHDREDICGRDTLDARALAGERSYVVDRLRHDRPVEARKRCCAGAQRDKDSIADVLCQE